jgi:hypothetical protein
MPSQSGPLQQPGAPSVHEYSGDLEQARFNALQTVVDFHRIVVSLEAKRTAQSRISSRLWEAHYIAGKREACSAGSRIGHARFRINTIFGNAAATNLVIFNRVTEHINRAQSEAKISELLLLMENNLARNSELRGRYAVAIMQRLKADLDAIIGFNGSQWYATAYRFTLGLETNGDYHPNPTPTIRYATSNQPYVSTPEGLPTLQPDEIQIIWAFANAHEIS